VRGVTFQGNGNVVVDDVAEPILLAPTDAIVKITMAGICGSDLHILNAGEAFGFEPGARLGHEFLGTLVEIGSDVRGFVPGDRVMVAVGVSCGHCVWCQEGIRASCEQMSIFGWTPRLWRHGGAVEGGQSEYARVPLAQTTMIKIPDAVAASEHEPKLVPIIDVMSTAMHGLVTGRLHPGDDVVVIGDGAVALSAVHCARALGAENIICFGHHADRLALARTLGATATSDVRDATEIAEFARNGTRGHGARVVVDSVSNTDSLQAAHGSVRPGGTISCLGMDHFMGKTPNVNWYDQFVRNITITGGLLPTGLYIPRLLELLAEGEIDPSPMLTNTLPLADAAEGYRMMAERRAGAVKVAIKVA
jgi:threonine dehydrogenase-like Zn-dependent dehydrogenase